MRSFFLVLIATAAFAENFAIPEILFKQAIKLTHNHIPTHPETAPTQITVDLHNPKYSEGILYTDSGGVIQGDDLRIQARSIEYIKRKDRQQIFASGDLLLQFKGKAYVGEKLEFDLDNKTGILHKGRTHAPPFYVGGEKIYLFANGNYKLDEAFLTTCENVDSTWDIHAGHLRILKNNNLLQAQKVRFRLFSFPIWLPSFKWNLKKFEDPFLSYNFTWDATAGPRAMVRYQLFSWKTFALYVRGQYRITRGLGATLETEFYPENGRTEFVTRNYVATDIIPNNIFKTRRYRLVGIFHNHSESGNTHTTLTWDKYSDVMMPGDFKDPDFSLNAAQRTEFYAQHKQEDFTGYFYARKRINPFQSIREELPTIFANMRPIALGPTGIVSENWAKVSYLNFRYSDRLPFVTIPSPHAARLETHNELYRPVHMGSLLLQPSIGVIGIYYGNNPDHKPIGFGLIQYGLNTKCAWNRIFAKHKHVIEAYANFIGYTNPTTSIDSHYIFSIQDGYNRQNLLRFGIKNFIYSKRKEKADPTFVADLYADLFFGAPILPKPIPWGYLVFSWNLPSISFISESSWTFLYQMLNFSKFRFEWTINADVALSLEFRYRSQWYWRKADKENFFLDLTRTQESMRDSPVSDRRITIITHLYWRLHPFWSLNFRSHHGFYRYIEPPYNEYFIDLFTWISSNWQLRMTYERVYKEESGGESRFNWEIKLIK